MSDRWMRGRRLPSPAGTRRYIIIWMLILICGGMTLTLSPAHAATTFLVNTTADTADPNLADNACDVDLVTSGNQCTLRAAVQQANATAGADTIDFQLPGCPPACTIAPATPLPQVTESITIDGTTQPGYAGKPIVVLDGTNAPALTPFIFPHGLEFAAADNTVKGLVIINFAGSGIFVRSFSGRTTIAGNYIGVAADGTTAAGNANGVSILAGPNKIGGTIGTTPGGPCTGSCNVISGNLSAGIFLNAPENVIQGNFIGIDATGTTAVPNAAEGLHVQVGSTNSTFGGTAAGARNVISGNGQFGVHLYGSSNFVQGNFIGTNSAGTSAIPNAIDGVHIEFGYFNMIGGVETGAGNIIAFNGSNGVVTAGARFHSILGNAIFANGTLGIDLDRNGHSPNEPIIPGSHQNFPNLTSATTSPSGTTISGTLNSIAGTDFRIEFFSNVACDPSGVGEGQTYIGFQNVTTDASGNASFTATFPTVVAVGHAMTATATRLESGETRETSEFPQCQPVVQAAADMSVAKSASATSVKAGDNITYTITVTNNGPSAADATLNDPLPANTTLQSLSAPGWTCTAPAVGSSGVINCTIAELAAGASSAITLMVRVNAGVAGGTSISNTATVSTRWNDTTQSNNSANVTTTVASDPPAPPPPTLTPTPTPTATPPAASQPGGQGQPQTTCTPGVATLTTDVQIGSSVLPVACQTGFSINDVVWINQGGTNAEIAQIRGFGSLLLTKGVSRNHAPGETITRCPSCLAPVTSASNPGMPVPSTYQALYGSGYRGPQANGSQPSPSIAVTATPAAASTTDSGNQPYFSTSPSSSAVACPSLGQWLAGYWRGSVTAAASALAACPQADRLWVRRGSSWMGALRGQTSSSDEFSLERGELAFVFGTR